MISGIASSLTGISAAQAKLSATAHNIANAQTDEFKKHRVILEESSAGGVQVKIDQPDTPGPTVFEETDQGLMPIEQSNVDLGEAMVDLLIGRRFFEANVGALKVQDDTLGSLLDILE